jgi:hypothetical protein
VKPEPAHALERLMQALLGDVMPNVQPGYRQASVMVHGMVVAALREEIDRAAARRVEENAALRALFADAAPVVADAALQGRLAAAARDTDASLLVPALEEGNRALRALLIELHAHVETLPGEAARRVDAAIWRELAASTERRKLSLGPC